MKAQTPDQNISNNNKETKMASTPCPKCLGTGKYNVPLKDGSIGNCFACKGTGIKAVNDKPASDAQIKYICDLFGVCGWKMTEDQKKNLINAVSNHINGIETKSMTWGCAAIEKLKAIKAGKA
jgi:hypothetical protein